MLTSSHLSKTAGALAVLVVLGPAVSLAQVGGQCPRVPQLSTVGAKYAEAFTYSFSGPNLTNNIQTAFSSAATMWSAMNNYAAEGNRAQYSYVPSGGTITVVGVLPDGLDGAYSCPTNDEPAGRCRGRIRFSQGGMQTSGTPATIELSTGPDFVHALNAALHELFHHQGMEHTYDSRSLSYAYNSTLTEVTLCDAEAAGRWAKQRRRGSLPDPCVGRDCDGVRHPQAPPCYYGSLPNGQCLPDPRYKHPPGGCDVCAYGVPPLGAITTTGLVPGSGQVNLASKDLDGMVTRVDWYAYGPGAAGYVYTSVTDPFALPYANIPAGNQYSIYALVWDDVDKTTWVGPVSITVQAGGGGGGGGSAWLPNYLSLWSHATGLYVGAQGDLLVANRGSAETLTAQFLSTGQYALRAPYNGYYVAAEGGGGGAVRVNRSTVGSWEIFDAVSLGGSDVAFRTLSGHFLRVDPASGVVDATATSTDTATRFRFQ